MEFSWERLPFKRDFSEVKSSCSTFIIFISQQGKNQGSAFEEG